jgi:hypothetical protein
LAALALWIVASEPWGMAVYELIVFAAPGALMGMGASWMSYVSARHEWTWTRARNAALAGALLAPPFLAFLIAVDGNARPHRLLAGFIRAAWLAFGLGVAIAVARSARSASQERRKKVRSRFQHPLPAGTPEKTGNGHLARAPHILQKHRVHLRRKALIHHDERGFVVERQ